MLKILVSGIDPIPDTAIMDAEKAFAMVTVSGADSDKFLLHEIEKGAYKDSTSFIDRFGNSLWIDCLSTGCKAAIAVTRLPNEIINCTEAGVNAISALIKCCKEGTIIVPNAAFAFDTVDAGEIDVTYRGWHYTNFDAFAAYMYNAWPVEPKEWEENV